MSAALSWTMFAGLLFGPGAGFDHPSWFDRKSIADPAPNLDLPVHLDPVLREGFEGPLSLRVAHTLPPGRSVLALSGGFLFGRVADPVVPLLSGEAELGIGLLSALDLRLRYGAHLGVIHRLGPELRVTLLRAQWISVGLRSFLGLGIAGSLQKGIDIGGDLASSTGVLLTLDTQGGALSFEAGFTTEWVLFENLDGQTFVDDQPRLESVDFSVAFDRALRPDLSLSFRLEIGVPSAPDDPFTVLGVRPRILAGTCFDLGL